ncbi:MAG: hypothetical protein A2157_05715 [Deltaproteobacteria bacterium RBG_16_47_11]|nr:MAG: hypothetical protein A2157_05715 [Deltaproteobacteria bacterium RBG_16_47_11]
MNHTRYYQILIIFLFIIVSAVFCLAEVEIKVWNEKTKKYETFNPTSEEKAKMERQERQMRGEKARTEEERKARMKDYPQRSPSTSTMDSQPVILVVPSEEENQPQWQIPTFKGERAKKPPHGEWQLSPFKEDRRGQPKTSTPPSLSINPSGATDSRGDFYWPTGGGYVNSRTGEFVPAPWRPRDPSGR